MKEELLKGLTNEQINKVKSCKNNDELLSLAKHEGIELSNEQLEAINGGGCSDTWERKCPKCGSTEFDTKHSDILPPLKEVEASCSRSLMTPA